MRPIIVATDFSPNAWNAACYAADMAMSINGYLVLLHVWSIPLASTELPMPIDATPLLHAAEEELEQLQTKLVERTRGKLIIDAMLKVGNFPGELKAFCNDVRPYAVVMGSQGKTAAERFVFGAHTIYATRHLIWPLIAVPPGAEFSAVKKIGVACDFNNVIELVPVDELKALVMDFHAELHLLNISKPGEFNADLIFQSGIMREMLDALHPVYHFIANNDVDESILHFAENNDIDLLVVLPKRHSLVNRLVHKSHTKQLVLHSHIPVMALHHHE